MTRAAAAYGQGRTSTPPAIVQAAARYGAMGDDAWLTMPAATAFKLRPLHNIYSAFKSYTAAGRTGQAAQWANSHPGAWDIVSSVLAEQKYDGS